jgi:FlaA1/EpsC-like NDP-sugar epimerase
MSKRYLQNFAPRWIVFCCDSFLIGTAFMMSFFLIHHLSVDLPDITNFLPAFFINLGIGAACIACFSIYKGIIRYSEIKDIVRIIKFALAQMIVWFGIHALTNKAGFQLGVAPSLIVVNFFAVIFLLVGFRLLVKEIYFRAQQPKLNAKQRTLIFGAGMMGQITKKVLEQDITINSTLIGFIDDSYYKDCQFTMQLAAN